MGIESTLDISVLKTSAMISSTYISLVLLRMSVSSKKEVVGKQATGFVILFFISLLVYLVI